MCLAQCSYVLAIILLICFEGRWFGCMLSQRVTKGNKQQLLAQQKKTLLEERP